eukprot:TRINITY_DN20796_c0_g1_i1.p1 TRINITY_DN20796_c0_g1~~TRINITY_DN20796_c0_g1_i1.p1  ORF type:complete len:601 (+),score=95.56 TRINITY_DN20796_c0_g1_i1:32-1804(+)
MVSHAGYAAACSPVAAPSDRFALVACDLQPDLLNSLPAEARNAFLKVQRVCLEAAKKAGWLIVFTGLRFPSGYAGVGERHRLYGGFRRLNAKVGDKTAHWFMEGHEGAEIEPSVLSPLSDGAAASGNDDNVVMAWRRQHLPGEELLETLRVRGITKVTVIGLKASHSVQATCQALCNEGLAVYAIRECIQDDSTERLAAVLKHFLPIYADIVTWQDFLEGIGMEEGYIADQRKHFEALFSPGPRTDCDAPSLDSSGHLLCTDCKRGGHGQLFCKYLLERPAWRDFPTQEWFQDEYWKEYYCPSGKRVVDFADEPQFSRVAMYLKGREWLEDKLKILEVASEYMPDTYIIERGQWKGKQPPSDDVAANVPWFVKQADRNWGTCIRCCLKPSECTNATEEKCVYVVQPHIANPLLMDDGRKCHIKFYILLVASEDGTKWTLYTYKDGYMCISPNEWSPSDTSIETQVTIVRNERISEVRGWNHWADVYPKCKNIVADVVSRTLKAGKLQGRPGKQQFEIFSADFVADTNEKAWLLEFNFDPVLRDVGYSATVNDAAMVRSALSIVFPWEKSDSGLWDVAGEFNVAATLQAVA